MVWGNWKKQDEKRKDPSPEVKSCVPQKRTWIYLRYLIGNSPFPVSLSIHVMLVARRASWIEALLMRTDDDVSFSFSLSNSLSLFLPLYLPSFPLYLSLSLSPHPTKMGIIFACSRWISGRWKKVTSTHKYVSFAVQPQWLMKLMKKLNGSRCAPEMTSYQIKGLIVFFFLGGNFRSWGLKSGAIF